MDENLLQNVDIQTYEDSTDLFRKFLGIITLEKFRKKHWMRGSVVTIQLHEDKPETTTSMPHL
jgi:hypothetical protein